ncbi:hypothetical protein J0H58_20395 [bacterium]|nr:hypothetical protein [bacterium]
MDKTAPPDWVLTAVSPTVRKMLEDGSAIWDQAQADAIIRFAERDYRTQYKIGGGALTLREEQRRFLSLLYGMRLADGRRLYRFATLHVPKKSFGKSLLLCIIAAFELVLSGEPSPLILAGAATKDNSAALYKEVSFALKQMGFDKPHVKFRDASKKLEIPYLNASLECVCKWGQSNHGPNASLCLVDECHVAHESMYNAMRYAGRTRPNFMCVLASTAGSDTTHWYYSVYQKAKRVQAGEDEDYTHLAFLCEADPEADLELCEDEWKRANPNLGAPECPLDTFRAELKAARSTGLGAYLNFIQLNLNIWVKPSEHCWFDCSAWDRWKIDPPSDEELKQYRCWIGGDGSQTTDPSSVTLIWDMGEYYYVRSRAWVCKAGAELREKANLPLFAQFPEVELTDGSMIDYRLIRDYILDNCERFNVSGVYFDPTFAHMMLNEIMEEGHNCKRVPQNYRHFDPAMREFKRAWDEGRVRHDGSSWLRYCFSNVRVEISRRTNEMRCDRGRSVDKIDGAVSTLLGFLGLIVEPAPAAKLGGVG